MFSENGHIFWHELTVFYKIILHKVDTNENHCNLSDNRDQGNVLSGFHAYVYKNRYFYEIWRKEAWLQCVNVALYPITSLIRSCPFIQIFRIFIFLTAWHWKCSLRCTKIIILSWHLNIWKVMPLCEVWIFFIFYQVAYHQAKIVYLIYRSQNWIKRIWSGGQNESTLS